MRPSNSAGPQENKVRLLSTGHPDHLFLVNGHDPVPREMEADQVQLGLNERRSCPECTMRRQEIIDRLNAKKPDG